MNIRWEFTTDDVARVRAVIGRYQDEPWVRDRHTRNLAETKPTTTREAFWQTMVSMRLTTRQLSGPSSRVARFNGIRPFPLRYDLLLTQCDRPQFIRDVLERSDLRRFNEQIPSQLSANLYKLEKGEWSRTLEQCNRLTVLVSRDEEREVADYIDDQFAGFGPKQARNVLQELGLTRYEIPIDSRLTRWLNDFEFPIRLSADPLNDREFYHFVLDSIQLLCEEAGVFPCVFDAAVFASQETR